MARDSGVLDGAAAVSLARRAVLSGALVLAHAAAMAQERVGHALGEFEILAAPEGVLVAAPHGTADAYSDRIAIAAAGELRAGYLVARRFMPPRVRINVNRPTEGAFLPCAEEAHTDRARDVYEAYGGLVARAAAGNPLRLYVEVHGNSNAQTARNIEVATVGITAAQARKVKEAYAGMLARARERAPDYPEFNLLIQPVDRVYYTAGCAKKLGIFASEWVPRGLHFEFPRVAREGDALRASVSLVSDIVRLVLDNP